MTVRNGVPRRPRRFRLAVGGVVGLLALWTFVLLLVPLPPAAVRALVLHGDRWILTDYLGASSGPLGYGRDVGRKLLATYLQHSLIRQYQRGHPVPPGQPDVQRLVARLQPLRALLVTQQDVPHLARGWKSFISGVGFCDQVNGVAAEALADEFSRAQTFALVRPGEGSPHSVGRVWSSQHGDWLYFDIFWGGVVVYRYLPGEGVRLLAREGVPEAAGGSGGTPESLEDLYALTEFGAVLNEYRPTFLGYMVAKLQQAVAGRTLYSVAPVTSPSAAQGVGVVAAAPLPPREYLLARLEHILGSEEQAGEHYRRFLAREWTGADEVLRSAASVFGPTMASGAAAPAPRP